MSEQPSWQQPPASPPTLGPETMVGDIGVSRSHVYLPGGAFPIAGSQWTMTNGTYATERTSSTGVVLAVVLFPFLCFFSLLFLLMKEQRVQGSIQVHVSGTGFQHSTVIYAAAPHVIGQVTASVNWARQCAGVG